MLGEQIQINSNNSEFKLRSTFPENGDSVRKWRGMKFLKLIVIFLTLILIGHSADIVTVTLISPEPGGRLEQPEVILEGLVSDYSVKEVKILLNQQEVRFIPVTNGFFTTDLFLDERVNRLTIYGATPDRKYFRQEFSFINMLERERTVEERVPPSIIISGLKEDEFKIISPADFSKLKVLIQDNADSVVQCGYVLNDSPPVYLKWNKGEIALDLLLDATVSHNLHVFAIDGDGNKTTANYHFRVEPLDCSLAIEPSIGLFETVPITLQARVNGGMKPLKYHYQLIDGTGRKIEKHSTQISEKVSLDGLKTAGKFKGYLRVVDSRGIDTQCESSEVAHFFSAREPTKLKVMTPIRFQSIEQELRLELIPPTRGGEVVVLLKEYDPQSGFTGQVWKALGRKKLESRGFKKDWQIRFSRRVPPGNYMMKISFAVQGESLIFTDTIPINVARSKDDTVDLLEEILRDELE